MDLPHDSSTARFLLFEQKVLPELRNHREQLLAMYDPVMGREPVDPVILLGITLLQMMERLPDRKAIEAFRFDLRWKMALGVEDWEFHPTTLVYFRNRLLEHGLEALGFEAILEPMRCAGYLKGKSRVRIDSTHLLGLVASMSRWECVKETLRLSLEFLSYFGNPPQSWDRWWSIYVQKEPRERLEKAALVARMNQAGRDMADLLRWTEELGESVHQSAPIMLLERVWKEQYQEETARLSVPAGAVQNPHDPEAQWSCKDTLKQKEWVGYKVQVCETAEPSIAQEPTRQVITAVVIQPAITSDHGSLEPVLVAHGENPSEVFVDAGYVSGKELAQFEENKIGLTGPALPAKERNGRYGSDVFNICIQTRSATCPNGMKSTNCSRVDETKRSVVYRFEWNQSFCVSCPHFKQCVGKNQKHRTLVVGQHHDWIQARRRQMKTEEFKQRMKTRNGIEGTISECKRGYGLNKARYRGLKKVNLQALMTAAACNLRRWSTRILWELHQPVSA